MIVYVDMDDVLCNYTRAQTQMRRQSPEVVYPQSVPGFFLNLEPLAGAIRAVTKLREAFEVYILTAPSTRNPHSYTEKRLWIEQHFDYAFTKRLILSPNKGLLKGDYLIDDRSSGNGQENFEGKLLQFGTATFPNWIAIEDYFLSQDGAS